MKIFLFSLFAIALLAGCATQHQVATMQGQGKVETYAAPFDPVWRAAVDAAQVGGLKVVTADRSTGYISAQRGLQPTTFGENVGLWVRAVSPSQTQVEVVSRQAGPPAFWLKNWERDVFSSLRANLTREAGQTMMIEPAGAPRLYVPEQALPPVAPPAY
ncbi:MAG: hypothetical protein JWM68_3293 [Verrucomicrobiales bacterium]|nr:hypothetical protein [Verrucomicrobiales bacterium]